MIEEIDIDALFDKADADLRRRISLKDNPPVASGNDFDNPFYVIVHESQLKVDAIDLDPDLVRKVAEELHDIKLRYEHTKGDPFSVPLGLPDDRPILIAGVYREVCVMQQFDRLVDAGYFNTYISREGVLSYKSSFYL